MGDHIEEKKEKFVASVIKWAEFNLRDFPWRSPNSPYEVFIAETLLKRTTSTAAERVFKEFLKQFPDIKSLANADIRQLEEVLKPIGLYKQRSKGLKEAAQYIMDYFDGEIPNSYKELLKVPHIGPYSAGAIKSFGFGKPAPIVDSNVRRVVVSVFEDLLGESPKDEEVRSFLGSILPKKEHRLFNLGLIDLGALICNYREKKCQNCPLEDICVNSNY